MTELDPTIESLVVTPATGGFVAKFKNIHDGKTYFQSTVFKKNRVLNRPTHVLRNGIEETLDDFEIDSIKQNANDYFLIVSCDCRTYDVSDARPRMVTSCYGCLGFYALRKLQKRMTWASLGQFAADMRDVFERADIQKLLLGEFVGLADSEAERVVELINGKKGYAENEFGSRGWWIVCATRMRVPFRKFPVLFLRPTPERLGELKPFGR